MRSSSLRPSPGLSGHRGAHSGRRAVASVVVSALAVVGLAGLSALAVAAPARADTVPVAGTPATVSADALPTAQINGVVWAQVVTGDTVWATGSFTKARPAGVAAGGAGEVDAGNLVAYSISTGALKSFSHILNAQGLGITASPDKAKVYVVGEFTTVDGVTRNHAAAFNATTGALDPTFKPNVNAKASAVQATASTVYVGGNFDAVGGQSHVRLAAVDATTGAVQPWTATADDNMVNALVLTPDSSRLIVGGRFSTINGQPAYGLGAVDPTTGALLPWAAGQLVRDAGDDAGITSLSTDGTNIYGTGFVFGAGGNLEGTFAADPNSGTLKWMEDCHGDTYGAFGVNGVVYTVSHSHYCGPVGGFPQTSPTWTFHRAMAWTQNATGTLGHNAYGGYTDWFGQPSPSLLPFWPTLSIGSYTGQDQAAWAVAGNSDYVVMGGEFPKVNGVAQQGLVRFAVSSKAPNKVIPTIPAGAVSPVISTTSGPSAISLTSGTVRLAWTQTWDQDNQNLTYDVLRDGGNTPVYSVTSPSTFWTLKNIGWTDSGLAPGSTHTYRIRVSDPFGNKWTSINTSVTVGSGAASAYQQGVVADGASSYWRLGEPSGATAYDYAGFNDATEAAGVGHGVTGAIAGDTDGAASFTGDSTGVATSGQQDGPQSFAIEAWIKTTTTRGGKIVGFGDVPGGSGTSSSYDRHVYMANNGRIYFGVYNNAVVTINSTKAYNDGVWHHIVASMGSAGMSLYIDDKKIGTNTTNGAQPYSGYWRVGGDSLSSWTSKPTSNFFNGSIDDVAIYSAPLTATQIDQHWVRSGRASTIPAAPTDSYGQSVTADAPDLFWRLGETSGTTAADATGNNDGTYAGGLTLGQSGVYTNAVRFNGVNGTAAATASVTNPTVYSEELWFRTNTTRGGKLIGFGTAQTGNSGSYDRHVWMLNSGQLAFGAYTGVQNTIQTTTSFNDNQWHYVVATEGGDGMKLYVDGSLRGTNANTGSESYTGYWRIGGDVTWGGNTSNYFSGTIDEAAVYSSVLSPARVTAHYVASGLAPNQAPTAAFTSSCTDLTCSVDGSGSNDIDGTVASYAWDFGDGGAATGATAGHAYGASGAYTVKLTVTDNGGLTSVVTHPVTVTAPNQLPTAAFTSSCTDLACSFDGSTSSDADGSIASYAWDFGDGTDTGATPSHPFATAGAHPVTLTVTDNRGGTNAVTQLVTVTAPNQPPTAAFTSSCTDLACSFDGSTSTDADGTIASYAWDFGDGQTGSGATPAHTYVAAGGTFGVQLTVTDNGGRTDVVTHSVTVSPPPPNVAPTAAFSSSCTNLTCSFDGSGSSDSDGTVASYAWDFGDGASSAAATTSHAYAAAGTYVVTLTVTDNGGLTDHVSHSVTVTAPPPLPFGIDAFGRTVSNGLGTADTGGAWSVVGTATNYSVAGGVGSVRMGSAGAGPGAYLNGASNSSTDLQVTLSTDKAATGGGIYLWAVGRHTAAGDYRARVRLIGGGTVGIALSKVISGTETSLTTEQVLSGVTYAAGDQLRVRLQVDGTSPTTLRLKVWKVGSTEPATWQRTATDTTDGLQVAGGVGLYTYLSGSSTNAPLVAKFDDLLAQTVVAAG